ncbi:MAG: SPOR domain-containing protein [Campylobacteraceae bacterium]|nr:SPOR domain-containing protein [Campylobacteraceae bacterium]
MEIKGNNFIKNVQIKQEKDQIQQRLDEIERANPSMQESSAFQNEMNNIDIEEKELGDIMLDNQAPRTQSANKKKYIVLGLILIVLFLLTIVTIRLLSSNDSTDNSFVEPIQEEISQEEVLNNDNIEEQYQKIINQKLQSIKDKNIKLNDSINIEKTQADEIKLVKKIDEVEVKKVLEIKKEIMEIKEEKVFVPKVKKVVKKVLKKAPVSKPSGYFVQVGSFTKQPSLKYLNNITAQGYEYRLYEVLVKGKTFTKVLVGPYNNRNDAKANLKSIQNKLKSSGAWIIKI